MYDVKFKSHGDTTIAERVVELFKEAGLKARLTPKTEARGDDGRGFSGPGLDHGVFVPFSGSSHQTTLLIAHETCSHVRP